MHGDSHRRSETTKLRANKKREDTSIQNVFSRFHLESTCPTNNSDIHDYSQNMQSEPSFLRQKVDENKLC